MEENMNSKSTVIKNVNILTMNQNKDIIENGMVIYKDDKIVYVGCEKEFDDMILFSKDLNANKKIITTLKKQYDTKIINLGESDNEIQYDILGLEIKYQRGKYMKLGMENSLTEKIPN